MDPVYITAISALGGASIGGLTSFLGSWLTQRTQLRFTHHQAIRAQREALYAEFVDEASDRYADALGRQKNDVADLAKLFAVLGRIRLASPRAVVTASEHTFDTIIETYLGRNRTLHEVLDMCTRAASISLSNSARPADMTWIVTERWATLGGIADRR